MPEVAGTMRGWAVELDGKTIATFGLLYTHPVTAFSSVEPEMKKYPKVILKLGRRLMAVCDKAECDVYARADDEHPRSGQFLERLGFRLLGDGVYIRENTRG